MLTSGLPIANLTPNMSTDIPAPPAKSREILELTPMDHDSMYRYVTETGRILPRRITGLSSKQQRHITRTIKRGRNLLVMK